jgi:hypothetical protein
VDNRKKMTMQVIDAVNLGHGAPPLPWIEDTSAKRGAAAAADQGKHGVDETCASAERAAAAAAARGHLS